MPAPWSDPALVDRRVSFPIGAPSSKEIARTVRVADIPGIRLLGGVSLLDGVQVRAQDPRNLGRTAVGVPDAQVNLYAEYDLPPWLAPGLSLTGRVIYTAQRAGFQKVGFVIEPPDKG